MSAANYRAIDPLINDCLQRAVREQADRPSEVVDVVLEQIDYRYVVRLTVCFENGYRVSEERDQRDIGRLPVAADLLGVVRSRHWQIYEDHRMEREVRAVYEVVEEAIRQGLSGAEVGNLQRLAVERAEHIRRHHTIDGWAERWLEPAGSFLPSIPVEPRNLTATQIRLREEEARRLTYERPRFLEDVLREAIRSRQVAWFGDLLGDPEAEKRGMELFRAHLSAEQRTQYDEHKHFDVIGSKTGKRYRIEHGRQMNISELDSHGERVQGWCFLPSGGLVTGDVMLGQKIALETDEKGALAVANAFG